MKTLVFTILFALSPSLVFAGPSAYRITKKGEGSVCGVSSRFARECTEDESDQEFGCVPKEKIKFKATPAEGYKFVRWGGACGKNSKECSITCDVKAELKVIAIFSK